MNKTKQNKKCYKNNAMAFNLFEGYDYKCECQP